MATIVNEKLYALVDLRRVLDHALEATEGELTPEIEAALDRWETDFDAKCESIALLLTDLEGDAAKIKAEEERLATRRKAITSRCEWLEKYVKQGMEATQRTKIEGALKTLSLRKNQKVEEVVPSTEADLRDMAMIAPEFIRRVPETFAWDKDEIKRAVKTGTLPPDVAKRVRVVTTTSLQIR